jgi:hypothetical protein
MVLLFFLVPTTTARRRRRGESKSPAMGPTAQVLEIEPPAAGEDWKPVSVCRHFKAARRLDALVAIRYASNGLEKWTA